ncbi:DUF350 domain-containing protein [Plantactinospora sp. WMMB782]|uniref:DUF350 domain-containing protein n=1 Tax=Plantactinospora sp. WMMB782 TaxID=3404121 RepID=UPI003B935130
MVEDLLVGAWQSIVFGVVGIALMAAGFGLVDLLTPGRLRELIWVRRNGNAALLLLANQLGIAAIVFTAILTSYSDFAKGLASTVVFGVVGLGVMALGFLVLDWLTPGRLGEVICTDEPHPAARVSAATHLGTALIVCACIA